MKYCELLVYTVVCAHDIVTLAQNTLEGQALQRLSSRGIIWSRYQALDKETFGKTTPLRIVFGRPERELNQCEWFRPLGPPVHQQE